MYNDLHALLVDVTEHLPGRETSLVHMVGSKWNSVGGKPAEPDFGLVFLSDGIEPEQQKISEPYFPLVQYLWHLRTESQVSHPRILGARFHNSAERVKVNL